MEEERKINGLIGGTLRALGGMADANTVLNTIVADALSQFADELEKADSFEEALHALTPLRLAV